MNKYVLAALLAGSAFFCHGQKRSKQVEFAPLHLGLTNGIGTNGIYDLKYENNVSLNLFTGQSFGNNILCISGISHFQVQKSQGIYISGISNVSGGFPFLRKEELEDSLASFNAIQAAGLFNVVNGKGGVAQLSGLSNAVTRSMDGFQFASVYNYVGKGFSGFQLSVLANRIDEYGVGVQTGLLANSSKNLTGVQLPALVNVVNNDLDGLQLGVFNYIGNKKSTVYRNFHFFWLQVGAINRAIQNSDGVQVGLINWGSDIGFSQFGVINISRKVPEYPVGFLNIGVDAESFPRFSFNRGRGYTIELATGSKKLMNVASYSFDPARDLRSIGYAIGNQKKGGFRKSEYFVDYYLTITQVKEQDQSFLDPNFIYGVKIGAGYNPFIVTKLPWMFFFVSLSANVHKISDGERLVEGFLSTKKGSFERWLGVSFGVQL